MAERAVAERYFRPRGSSEDSPNKPDYQRSMVVSRLPQNTSAAEPDILIIVEEHDCGVSLARLLISLSDMKIFIGRSTFANTKPQERAYIVTRKLCDSYLYGPPPPGRDSTLSNLSSFELKASYSRSLGALLIRRSQRKPRIRSS